MFCCLFLLLLFGTFDSRSYNFPLFIWLSASFCLANDRSRSCLSFLFQTCLFLCFLSFTRSNGAQIIIHFLTSVNDYDSRNIYYDRKFLMTILFRYTSISFALIHTLNSGFYFACGEHFFLIARFNRNEKYSVITCLLTSWNWVLQCVCVFFSLLCCRLSLNRVYFSLYQIEL